MIAVLFILLVTLAGLGIVVVNALANSPWGVFTIGMTVPIAFVMGVWMFKSPRGRDQDYRAEHLWRGVPAGGSRPDTRSRAAALPHVLTFNPHQITLMMMIYGFVASVLPVWLLLEPRDYLSTYVKLGTIAVLMIGVFVVHPEHSVSELHAIHSRRRADHQGQAISVFVRDDCLRRDLGIPLAGLVGNHAEDAG